MAETRSQTPLKIVLTDETREILLSLLVKMKETYEDGFAQISEQLHAFRLSLRSRDRKEENPEDQICNDEELAEIEAETKSGGIEDRAVENEANSKVISAIVKEESIPQFLMVTEADSTCCL
ncbi:hypothetical protein ISN44_As07g014990 [Arabidopsis suecica]|uniref:Uncharacterized protein n=1 Tax=Arabidopsis suecica TaxID=45249 RepID=A0A8T2BU85_ARASU|nr:hypothetical protein ISN44_As07g014990 [Arabidopsis suecica]